MRDDNVHVVREISVTHDLHGVRLFLEMISFYMGFASLFERWRVHIMRSPTKSRLFIDTKVSSVLWCLVTYWLFLSSTKYFYWRQMPVTKDKMKFFLSSLNCLCY